MKTAFLFRLALVLVVSGLTSGSTRAQVAGEANQTVYDISVVDQPPQPKRRIKPSYPASVRKRPAPVSITLRFIVTTEGKVTEISIVRFDDADMVGPAFDAYESARFNPGLKNGLPVNTRMEVTDTYPEPKAPKK